MNAINGVITLTSPYGVKETMDRLHTTLLQQGATVYARIDQRKEVEKTGLSLKPLEYILFGDPKAGGPLMSENVLVALDLPLKIIAWEHPTGETLLAYNDPLYMEKRYALTKKTSSAFDLARLISTALNFYLQ